MTPLLRYDATACNYSIYPRAKHHIVKKMREKRVVMSVGLELVSRVERSH